MVDRSRESTRANPNDTSRWSYSRKNPPSLPTSNHTNIPTNFSLKQILASILAALLLVLLGPSLPTWLRFSISPALLVGVLFARGHIKNHWASHNGKTVGKRIPLPNMEGYNEAQRATEEVLRVLEWVEYGWVANTLVVGLLGSR